MNVLRLPLVLACCALSLAAQTAPKPTFADVLAQARSPIVLADGKLSGAGADLLAGAALQSKFILLGEDHLTREIPEFAAAWCDAVHPDAYAVEAGPEAASVSRVLYSVAPVLLLMRIHAPPGTMKLQ